mmetsp:Transcript_60947/g.137829  ORF Transcript_60947/g.137829 Transcript_60947/m.137829 type:complete len:274 (+) Transcript_60947:1635-2456(+)
MRHRSTHQFVLQTANALLQPSVPLSWQGLVREPHVILALPVEILARPEVLRITLHLLAVLLEAFGREAIVAIQCDSKRASAMTEERVEDSSLQLLLECIVARSVLGLTRVDDATRQLGARWLVERSRRHPSLLRCLVFQGLPLSEAVLVCECDPRSLGALLPTMLHHGDLEVQVAGITLAAALATTGALESGSAPALAASKQCTSILVTFTRSLQCRDRLAASVLGSTFLDLTELIRRQPTSFRKAEGTKELLETLKSNEFLGISHLMGLLEN